MRSYLGRIQKITLQSIRQVCTNKSLTLRLRKEMGFVMAILEFHIIGNAGRFLWRPVNDLAKTICMLAHRKNLTKEQVDMCKALGFVIKETIVIA